MRHSDLFDDFAKLALERGLISEASPEELKKKLENDPRMDSLDISAIEALYGVKPDLPKDMKYKRNIIEDAHPNAVIVSPSYDKLNGFVENLNERQDILMHIIQRTPDGHLTQRKYAEQQLLLTLVRIGNDLDNKNQTELRVLADACLEQTATITKKAELVVVANPALAIAAVIASTLGAVYLQQHLPFINEGFQKNHDKLIAEVDDLLKASVSWGVGRKYTQGFLNEVQEFKTQLMKINNDYQRVFPVLKILEKARTGKELMILARSSDGGAVINAHKLFKDSVDDVIPYLNMVESNFKSESYKIRQIEDKGWMEKAVDWTQVLHGGWGAIADDFDDVVRAMSPYRKSIAETLTTLQNAESVEKNAQRQVAGALDQHLAESAPKPSETQSPAASKEDIDEKAKGLEAELSSLKII